MPTRTPISRARQVVRSIALLSITVLTPTPLSVSSAAAATIEGKPFGVASFSVNTTKPKAVPYGPGIPGPGFVNEPYLYTQAGGHPSQLTSRLEFASEEVGEGSIVPTRDPKDVVTDMPLGMQANPLAVPRCQLSAALANRHCPDDSQIGVFVVHFFGNKALLGPIVDLTPEPGQPAEFGLEAGLGTLIMQGRLVRTPNGYGIRVTNRGLPAFSVVSMETTLWGIPADPEHDPERGLTCAAIQINDEWSCEGGGTRSGAEPVPFLTMPTACTAGPLAEKVWADSWEEPGQYKEAQVSLPTMDYCERLQFTPEIEVAPQTLVADEPLGLGVNIENRPEDPAQAVATPPLRNATIILPSGVTISAAIADGVEACNYNGSQGIDMPTGLNAQGEPLGPEEIGEGEERAPSGEGRLVPGHCPEASTVGTAEAFSPLLPLPIKGHVYLAAPRCGGVDQPACTEADAADGNLYRMYIELGGETGRHSQGVDLKMEGKVEASPATGQLTVKLEDNPQLPLSSLAIHLDGGPRALLDNPANCGTARTTADLQPWSAPGFTPPPESKLMSGTADATPSSFYEVDGCSTPEPLHPTLYAGTLTPEAGAFSGFTATVIRGDREQFLTGLQMHTPPGLSALLASVPLCDSPHASAGTCPQASRIGRSLVTLGAGSHPFQMAGSIYLTDGYEGAPFGLSIVTNAVAGPLNLGLVVIRARVDVDPETSALTITSRSLPQIVFGAPLRIQRVTLDIDRANFIFNPTDCNELRITAKIAGSEGTIASATNRFEVDGCRHLAFNAKLTALVSAHYGDRKGASLDIKLKRPDLPLGAAANLAAMRVTLPKQLPVRLTALRNSCPQRTFTTDAAACPPNSIIGVARASTPVLPVQMSGPLYFVAHGPNLFPSPVLVLQGDGVRLNLAGTTTIDRKAIVHVSFPSLPDVPLSSFELYLPPGAHSMLDASTDLCRLAGGRLSMSTTLMGQNRAVIHLKTRIARSGCRGGRRRT